MKTMMTLYILSCVFYRTNSLSIFKSKFKISFSSAIFSTKLQNEPKEQTKIPITVLSGFLGSGKTSFIQKLVTSNENNKNRIGLVVNDMASVNIDAKQIKQQTLGTFDGIDTMELQNGCVCCTLAEDLLASVTRLITLSELKGYRYDHIIVECSGIAEPRKIRDLFQEAEDFGSNLIDKIKLDTLITVVDAEVFNTLFGTDKDISENSELAFTSDELKKNAMLDDEFGKRKITELLLEQVECADIILINKCDLLEKESDVELVKKVISGLNPTAKVLTCVRGEVENPFSIVGSAQGSGIVSWGILDEHRKMIAAVENAEATSKIETELECNAATCNDPTHHHEHSHTHDENAVEKECNVATCNDPTHHHDHSHTHDENAVEKECNLETCNDLTHHHEHSHSHDENTVEKECNVATCNDPTHHHEHSHSHASKSETTTAEERFGISSFVYKRRRPFHPIRFSLFLQSLGKLSINGVKELSTNVIQQNNNTDNNQSNQDLLKVKKLLLRSKGFIWMATSGSAAYFMSHAGQYLELMLMGRWWADINKNEWPEGLDSEILVDFDGEHGDRRQEMVFIGQFENNIQRQKHSHTTSTSTRKVIEEILDSCLLNDQEMLIYEKKVKFGDDVLKKEFVK